MEKSLWNWGIFKGWYSFEVHYRKSQDCLEGTVDKNMDIKVGFGEDSERSDESYRENFYHLKEYKSS